MESVYSALFPDGLKLRKLQDLVRDEATVDALWNMYILSEDNARALSSDVQHIQREASAIARSTKSGNAKASIRGTGKQYRFPRFSFL